MFLISSWVRRLWQRAAASRAGRQVSLAVESLGGWLMPENSPRKPSAPPHVELRCEQLEERLAPAAVSVRVWTGEAGDGLASNPRNWGGSAIQAGDYLLFKGPATANCTIDAAAPGTFANIRIDPSYAGEVRIARDVTVTTAVSVTRGFLTLQGGATLTAQTVAFAGDARIKGTAGASLEVLGSMGITWATFETLSVSVKAGGRVDVNDDLILNASRFNNGGTVFWNGGVIRVERPSVFNNFGSLLIRCDNFMDGRGVFNNYGTVKKLELDPALPGRGDFTTRFEVTFNNWNLGLPLLPPAKVVVDEGRIVLGRQVRSNAPFVVAAGATLAFEGTTFPVTLATGSDFLGSGNVVIGLGTTVRLAELGGIGARPPETVINSTCTVYLPDDMAPGTLLGPGTFNSYGPFRWTGGEIKNLTLNSFGRMQISGGTDQVLTKSSLNLLGSTTWDGLNDIRILNSTITNRCDFRIDNGQTIRPVAPDDQSKFINDLGGALKKRGNGKTTLDVKFVPAGGTVYIDDGEIVGGSPKGISGPNAKAIELNGGALAVAGVLSLLTGDTLLGFGTVGSTIRQNGGSLQVGGAVSVTGDYREAGNSTDTINVGTGALHITGAASLAGTLNLVVGSGFSPTLGQTFQIIADASQEGNFPTITGLDYNPSGSYRFAIGYNATDVTLTVVNRTSLSTPTVTSLSTTSGTTEGGTSVTITGTNFDEVSSVTFGGIPALSFTRNSSTQITATAPPQAAATIDVQVTNLAGTSSTSTASHFTYTAASAPTITGLSVTSGYTYGGTEVVITGTNLRGTTAVKFGSVDALAFEVLSGTQVRAWAPDQAAATVHVEATTYGGTSSHTSSDQFTYSVAPAPTVTLLGTSTGSSAGGTSVTITGTNFNDVMGVYFGGISADYTVSSSTSIVATAPPGAAGVYDVVVATMGGVSAMSSSDLFTYTAAPPPQVTGLSSSSGTTSGGNVVTISGNNFTGASAVLFGDTPADDYTVASPTTIYAVVPAHSSGTIDVSVQTPTGSAPLVSGDHYTFNNASAPTVSAASPSSSLSTAGGTPVLITGSNLRGTTSVLFGSTEAQSVSVLSDSAIIAVAPAHASGSVSLTVTTYSGSDSSASVSYSAASAPAVSALSDSGGPTTGGTLVTIVGSNFTGASAVAFGSLDADWFTVLDDTTILAYAPAESAATIDVRVTTPSGQSSAVTADHFTYSAASAPTVTGVSASSGGAGGGTLITITGTGFSDVQDVLIGGSSAADYVVNSDTQITALTQPHDAGTWDVVVRAAAGDSALSSSARFTFNTASAPTVSSLSASGGSSAGGATVSITGTNLTGASQVLFGDIPADSFTLVSDTQIDAVTPAQTPGAVAVRVVTPGGMSAPSSTYTYSAGSAPTISSVSLNSGSTGGGTEVRLGGANFTGTTAVKFGTVDALSYWVVNDSEVRAIAPPASSGSVNIYVTTTSGVSTSTATYTYSAASAPSVSGVSPSSGSAAGGETVVITGSNFTGASAVTFGGTAAWSFDVISDSAIVAVAPARASGTGTDDIRVTTPSGQSSVVTADHYTYNWVTASAPTVTALSVTTGTTAGGTEVILTGTDFAAASAVKFGTTNATSFTVLSNTSIKAVAPSGSAGSTNITVTTPGGTSATGSGNAYTYVSASVPTVTSLSTTSGSTAGGTSTTLTGTNFTGASAVMFGDTAAASFTVVNATTISATSPAHASGTINVSVTTSAGTSATGSGNQFGYTAASLPSISSLGTTSGTSAGGTSVTINGSNFTGAIGVFFDGEPAASYTVNSSSQITATTAAHVAGVVDVTVQTYAGTSSANTSARYTYTLATAPSVSSLGTTSGSTAGGTSVTINGSNLSGAQAVYFGGVPAASYTVVSSSQITAVSPSQAAGTIDVVVETTAGTSAVSSSDHFTYNAASAPAVTSLSPTGGSTGGGYAVVLTGTDFTGATDVMFGDTAASFSVDSATQITALAPPHASGSIYVRVTTPSGQSATGSGNSFTCSAASAPSVSSITPSGGSAAGGSVVTILGSNFTGASAVTFGSVDAWDFEVLSDTAIRATAPAQAAATVHIRVTTPSGQSSAVSADQFTYSAVSAPTISSVSPTVASGSGGTSVTITGTNLLGTTSVVFGESEVTFSIVSDTQVLATAPSSAAGGVDVVVSTPGGSASARFTFTAPAAPSISGLSTTSGSTAGGTTTTIGGSNFSGVSAVMFGDVPAASWTLLSSTSIQAVSPSQAAGTVDVRVVTPGGVSAVATADHFTYSAASSPSISSVSPSSAGATGGSVVSIVGSNFLGATSVQFGSIEASYTVRNATWISAVVPAATAGSTTITVTTPSGTSTGASFTLSSASTPSVSSLSVSGGSTSGGTEVTVLGSHFTGASAVKFGSLDADDFTVLSDTALRARAPAAAAGQIDLTVTGPGGTSSTSSATHFTYAAPSAPTVTSLSTSTASTAGTTLVTLTGTNFSNVSTVLFGSVPASTVVVQSSTQITALAPAQAAGSTNVYVVTDAGTSAAGSGNAITYSAASAPSLSSISPASAPTTGGKSVLLSGSNFSGASAVTFGTTAASFEVLSDGAIVATVPAHASGSVSVTVSTPSGTSSGVTFTYYSNAAPSGSSDSYTAHINTTLTVSAAGVLSNDSDSNSDPLFVDYYTNPTHGKLTLLGDGSFVYVPDSGYLGSDSFSYRASDGTAESGTVTVSISVVSPQRAAAPPAEGQDAGAALTLEALAPILQEAIARWAAAGLDAAELQLLHDVPVSIVDLPDDYLGLGNPDVIWLDVDAAGHGWFIDATPGDDVEFAVPGEGPAAGRMDLLTVVAHELAHVLGLPDLGPEAPGDALLAETLPEGVRRSPTAADVAAARSLIDASLALAVQPNGMAGPGFESEFRGDPIQESALAVPDASASLTEGPPAALLDHLFARADEGDPLAWELAIETPVA